jgi:hypothetical protein
LIWLDYAVEKNRIKNMSPVPSQKYSGRENTLAVMIPAMNEIETHTKGMNGILH